MNTHFSLDGPHMSFRACLLARQACREMMGEVGASEREQRLLSFALFDGQQDLLRTTEGTEKPEKKDATDASRKKEVDTLKTKEVTERIILGDGTEGKEKPEDPMEMAEKQAKEIETASQKEIDEVTDRLNKSEERQDAAAKLAEERGNEVRARTETVQAERSASRAKPTTKPREVFDKEATEKAKDDEKNNDMIAEGLTAPGSLFIEENYKSGPVTDRTKIEGGPKDFDTREEETDKKKIEQTTTNEESASAANETPVTADQTNSGSVKAEALAPEDSKAKTAEIAQKTEEKAMEKEAAAPESADTGKVFA